MALPTTKRTGIHPRLIANVAIDSASITNATVVETSVAVAGSRTDMVFLMPQADLEDGLVWAEAPRCAVNGTVIFKLGNISGSPINPASFDTVLVAI